MKNVSMKLRYFVAGFLVAIILSTGVVAFASPETRQLFFGINVVIGGQKLELEGINRPFILDGRTFLPVAVIAEALGIPVEWDGNTHTVYIGSQSPLVGHWELIRITSMTDEEFEAEMDNSGSVEMTFFANGRLDITEEGETDTSIWDATSNWILVNGIQSIHYKIESDGYLWLNTRHNFEESFVFRRVE